MNPQLSAVLGILFTAAVMFWLFGYPVLVRVWKDWGKDVKEELKSRKDDRKIEKQQNLERR